ncbi:bifunctional alpha,alpha-trehalose-phosphate synthase (UDP-forming)/trehalose-phosphatase [Rubritalea spongiae]|uniref:Bifunctional alpha,alpha-trehalose-phosphate synthase (UDP-forming)/trehalose-phosphatase n=1 Tax=Rubritalea spongiae TaxID=430797 RepID=A0ABW5E2L5_9BACT
MRSLILVSNRLPIKLNSNGSLERTTGGLASALEGAGLDDNYTWVGWGGSSPSKGTKTDEFLEQMRKLGVEPVLLSDEEVNGYYEGYSNSTLWPLLHYMTERARFQPEWIRYYRQVNEKFADTILNIAAPGATIWIHDYHLMLLPKILRQRRPDLKIGFFLHTPFPSSEVFRALPERDELLKGMLGCDLIGFHTYNYLRHFISSLIRILGQEADVDGLQYRNRRIQLGVHPIGHNHHGFKKAAKSDIFQQTYKTHREQLEDDKLILSVERLDYTKGVPQKLDAIRHFLETHPEQANKVYFVLIAVPSRRGVEEYDNLTEEVQCAVSSINGTFGEVGHAPVQFLHRSFALEELAALYALADVCMVTPTVDGMNLVAKEFIDCKRDSHRARPGALILSEFAGAAQEMSHALLVNPHDTVGVANTIQIALDMEQEEMEARVQAMQKRLDLNHAGAWAKRYLTDLENASQELPCSNEEQPLLDISKQLHQELNNGKKLALFIDYDGTLRPFTAKPEDATPNEELKNLLQQLGEHPQIEVAIVSGRPRAFMEKHLGDLPLHLVAEHGFYWKLRDMDDWELLNEHVDTTWKETVLPHLEAATALTPGSEVEEKNSALVWHYRQADPEFALWRAKGLLSELTSTTASLPVSVHHGQKIIEVASQLVNKGVAVERMLQLWHPRIAVTAGDDVTDETMFACPTFENSVLHSLKIGEGDTRANQRTTIQGLRNLLESLVSERHTL